MKSLDHLVEKYESILKEAVNANHSRTYYAHWPEVPSGKIYGETANEDGQQSFKNRLNKEFNDLRQTGDITRHGEEESPYGFQLGVSYPIYAQETLVANAQAANREWRKLSTLERAAVLIHCLEQSARSFFDIAYATMHTTGQGFMMAFQASGPHAYDRALEAVALGYSEIEQFDKDVSWRKQVGRDAFVTVAKKFTAVPKGVGLVVGCSTFPVWNSMSAIFANLITGNSVVVKPHPKAVLPIAIVVADIQAALADLEIDPHLVQLAADSTENPLAVALAENPAVKVIDYTGGSQFGERLERIAAERGAAIYTEKAGVNAVILDSVDNLDAALDNLAFSLCLYSGQMCTAPQNFFIAKSGVREGDTVHRFDDVAAKFVEKIRGLAGHPKMGAGTLGALQNPATTARVAAAADVDGAEVLLASATVEHKGFDNARTATPLVLKVDAQRSDIYEQEQFGPIVYLIPTEGFEESLDLLIRGVRNQGALTTLVYTTDSERKTHAEERILFEAGAPAAFNFTGFVWVNQSAAFSDFHGAGANNAGNASFSDSAFVTGRFNMIGTREVVGA